MRFRVVIVAAALVLGWRLAQAPGVRGAAAGEDAADPATREMAALLRERAAAVNPEALSLIVNDKRAELLNGLLARPMPVAERLPLRGRAVVELAQAGRPRDALRALEALEQDARESDPGNWQRYRAGARLVEAMAYMRLGEDENCHAAPNRDACLLPIRAAGVHGAARGIAAGGARIPGDPEGQPRRPDRALAAQRGGHDAGRAPAVGAAGAAHPGERLRFRWTPDGPLRRGGGRARDQGARPRGRQRDGGLRRRRRRRRRGVVVRPEPSATSCATSATRGRDASATARRKRACWARSAGPTSSQADYDNDGDVDVLVLRGGWLLGDLGRQPPSLLRNDGRGRFVDRTEAAGLLFQHPTQAAAWGDYDNDGWLDLFVGLESSQVPYYRVPLYRPFTPTPMRASKLFHNNRNGTFTEMSRGRRDWTSPPT